MRRFLQSLLNLVEPTQQQYPDGYQQYLNRHPYYPSYPNSADRVAEGWFIGVLGFLSIFFALFMLWICKDYVLATSDVAPPKISSKVIIPIGILFIVGWSADASVLLLNWKHAERQYVAPNDHPCTKLKIFLLGGLILFPLDILSWFTVIRRTWKPFRWNRLNAVLLTLFDVFWWMFGLIIVCLVKTPACCVPVMWYTGILYCIVQGVVFVLALLVIGVMHLYEQQTKPKYHDPFFMGGLLQPSREFLQDYGGSHSKNGTQFSLAPSPYEGYNSFPSGPFNSPPRGPNRSNNSMGHKGGGRQENNPYPESHDQSGHLQFNTNQAPRMNRQSVSTGGQAMAGSQVGGSILDESPRSQQRRGSSRLDVGQSPRPEDRRGSFPNNNERSANRGSQSQSPGAKRGFQSNSPVGDRNNGFQSSQSPVALIERLPAPDRNDSASRSPIRSGFVSGQPPPSSSQGLPPLPPGSQPRTSQGSQSLRQTEASPQRGGFMSAGPNRSANASRSPLRKSM